MPDKLIYEYAYIRVVPKVERGECINVGVILLCKRKKYLDMRYHINAKRLQAFAPDLDLDELQSYLAAWERVCHGKSDGGRIAEKAPAERFRWLTAVRSTILQSSKVHPGLCSEPEQVLDQLLEEGVK